jgi:Ca2+-binding EF-hand superfamily protein
MMTRCVNYVVSFRDYLPDDVLNFTQAEKSCQYLRLKLSARLDQFCDGSIEDLQDTFSALVEECDKQKKGYLNRSGFRYLLRKLKLHFTDKRFNEVMDVIDANFE